VRSQFQTGIKEIIHMAQKDDSSYRSHVEQGDKYFAEGSWSNAYSSYNSAYQAAAKVHGFNDPALAPLMEKFIAATLKYSDHEHYLKPVPKMLRALLYFKEQEFGLDSVELVPYLERLVMFYDLDGAHMLAIEVKQRIDDIKERNAASKDV